MDKHTAIKNLIMKRQKLVEERDAMGIDPDALQKSLSGGMAGMAGIMGQLSSLPKVISLSQQIEALSQQITEWAVAEINRQEEVPCLN